jgi:hypothetical protein
MIDKLFNISTLNIFASNYQLSYIYILSMHEFWNLQSWWWCFKRTRLIFEHTYSNGMILVILVWILLICHFSYSSKCQFGDADPSWSRNMIHQTKQDLPFTQAIEFIALAKWWTWVSHDAWNTTILFFTNWCLPWIAPNFNNI